MKTFAINTLGCKVNQYESQQIREFLEQLGLNHVGTSKKADMVVVNTCCVTHTASAKSRQSIRKSQKLNPDAVIFVSGCLSNMQTDELNNPSGNIHLIRHKDNLAAVLSQAVRNKNTNVDLKSSQVCQDTAIRTENTLKIKSKNKSSCLPKLPQLTSFKGQTRAFLKVQDGCDGYCSYCIIPKTRPDVHSKPAKEVFDEAKVLVEAGHKEIVVTGIFLGAYGQGTVRRKKWERGENNKLAELLEGLAEVPDLARIRLSSLEPTDVTERLLDVFCKHRNIMPHLHLSLQSGSDAILKKMCRQYSAEQFIETVGSIKSRLDRPALTSDIIVGFPGETDADFQATVDLAKEIGFAKMHVFSFSPRKGTVAAGSQDAINNKVIKERSKILRDLDIELGRKFRQRFIGEVDSVLVESSKSKKILGRSERYFDVYIEKTVGRLKKNDLVRVKLTENMGSGVAGEVVKLES
ncbi:MAG: tRNA (N(6)-L-threonylcarbamoyladenosine(37)-C(2))-methylthiotransferase MtaB [Planctomycetes bacterium]|nr:tRNA (N(6)-L-threonylcarbamoyladenosine(37)-C(2))-methylthiotransferase MtaB [Planctomycetota bacterium]